MSKKREGWLVQKSPQPSQPLVGKRRRRSCSDEQIRLDYRCLRGGFMSVSIFRVSGTIGAVLCMQCYMAGAALAEGPAVSGPNGKIEVSGGGVSSPASGAYRIGGSIAVPL